VHFAKSAAVTAAHAVFDTLRVVLADADEPLPHG
jgi:hypothetical protein